MPLTAGDRLCPDEIVSPLGAGGMGEVYKARDPRLDRLVALKVSKAEFTERFSREARTVAQLNHPRICILHDVGPNYLVMEFVEGSPLQGPLPLDKALEYIRCRYLCPMGSTSPTFARERQKWPVFTADLWTPNRRSNRGSAFWQANWAHPMRTNTSSSCAKTR